MDAARVLLRDPGIAKGKLAESVKGDALHEASGNDTIRVDVVTGDEDATTCDLSDFF